MNQRTLFSLWSLTPKKGDSVPKTPETAKASTKTTKLETKAIIEEEERKGTAKKTEREKTPKKAKTKSAKKTQTNVKKKLIFKKAGKKRSRKEVEEEEEMEGEEGQPALKKRRLVIKESDEEDNDKENKDWNELGQGEEEQEEEKEKEEEEEEDNKNEEKAVDTLNDIDKFGCGKTLIKREEKEKNKKTKKDNEDIKEEVNNVRNKEWYKNPREEGYNPKTLLVPKRDLDELTPAKNGKFYELFYMDAELGNEICGLEMIKGKKEAMPHVGFPENSFAKYADAFVNYGHKVYRIEQMETPEEAKKRINKSTALLHVMKIIINDCYLLGICEQKQEQKKYDNNNILISICFVDVTIGQFYIGSFRDDRNRTNLRTLLVQIRPTEIVYNKNETSLETLKMLKTESRDAFYVSLTEAVDGGQIWNSIQIRQELMNNKLYWKDKTNMPTILQNIWNDDMQIQCIGNIILYLKSLLLDTQIIPNSEWKVYDNSDNSICHYMSLDGATITNLEILCNEDGNTKGTLFSFLNKCQTAFGQRRLKEWIISPLKDIVMINERLDCVEFLIKQITIFEETRQENNFIQQISLKLKSLPDLMRLLARISALGTNRIMDKAVMFDDAWKTRKVKTFCQCLDGLETAFNIFDLFESNNHLFKNIKLLNQLMILGDDLIKLKKQLNYFKNGFDITEAKSTGFIRPKSDINKEYDNCLIEQQECYNELDKILRHYQNEYKDKNIKYQTQKGKNRSFQLEFSKSKIKNINIPESWQQVASTTKVVRYRIPEVIKYTDLLNQLKEKEEMLLRDSARIIFADFAQYSTMWRKVVNNLADLDCLLSLSYVSYYTSFEMSKPIFIDLKDSPNNKPFLELRQARHPCLIDTENISYNNSNHGSQYIPNDTILGCEENSSNFIIVTGPNMGGKSTLLRQTCICMILAHIGCFVPSSLCRLTPIDRIFTRVGANDRILMGQSTFMVELEETSNILRHATSNSLVILDELGRGTSTFDGTAIAQSVAQYLIDVIQCRSLFSTHYHGICDAFIHNPAVAMYHMSFAKQDNLITFLYHFTKGICKESHGIHCARLAGLQVLYL
ncbi:DNA repair protein [Reticulomyxa filosa]|uniref:DNA repair protein n=1 Tax=Reticulomyxa filosa TaxID=46433 RepID=X6M3R3_RETFI|nr:DNA repair protein [Reticulomyxa filosa]|eukprot:ETO07665.1 DNA repair protein [Reticulomyxa filosa]